jgi:hypothetical protein
MGFNSVFKGLIPSIQPEITGENLVQISVLSSCYDQQEELGGRKIHV